MNPLFLGTLFEFGKDILNRFIPDPEKRREAEMEMVRMAAEGELKQVLGQLEINAREATHPSVWVAGWRPGFGWASVAGFLYSVMLHPMLVWLASIKGWPVPPAIDTDLLWVVVTGMLGIGGLRSVEKMKGVAAK